MKSSPGSAAPLTIRRKSTPSMVKTTSARASAAASSVHAPPAITSW